MTRVKICGLTNVGDALCAAEAGADLLGFIFYPPSPRYVPPESARRIADAVRRMPSPVRLVGVFVDEEEETIKRIASLCGLDYAQLHGAESPAMASSLMAQGLDVIKSFRVRDESSLMGIERYQVAAYLLDAYVAGRPGGTGRTFDWALVERAKAHGPVILAGGLNPDNVIEAVRATAPWGVDASSGVELEPGRKDGDKVRHFVAAVRSSEAGGAQ